MVNKASRTVDAPRCPRWVQKRQIEPIRSEAKQEAKRIVNIMAEQHGIEDEYAKAALETAVESCEYRGQPGTSSSSAFDFRLL